MPSLTPFEILLKDPLSKETRSERRTLLSASAIGIIIVKTGLVPSKISALGIDFNQTDQRSLLRAIAAIVLYFLIAFLIYAGSDFIVWRLAYRTAVAKLISERNRSYPAREDTLESDRDALIEMQKVFPRISLAFGLATPMSALRAAFEFGLPILISLYATISLLRARV